MYRYDLHVHDKLGSRCAVSTPEELVKAYAENGMSGFVSTNHFIYGNTAIDRNLPWKERMLGYYDCYLRAKAEAEKYPGFTVLFGIEHAYAGGREVLLYGADIDYLIAHPELENTPIDEFCKIMKENGVLTATAHPYRVRSYNAVSVRPDPDFVEGVEVYNSHNSNDGENNSALLYAKRIGAIMLSGGDMHSSEDNLIGDAGIETEKPILTNEDLLETLKSGEYKLIVHGKAVSLDEVSFSAE